MRCGHGGRLLGIAGLCIALAGSSALGSERTGSVRLTRELALRGYENIDVQTTDSVLVVWCENRRIRYPVVWMIEALSLAAASVTPETPVRIVAEKLARPVVSVQSRAEDVRRWIRGELSTERFRERLTVEFAGREYPARRVNPSLRRVDLLIGPGRMLSEFGRPDVWIKADFDVSARLVTALAPGITAYGRIFVPVYNRGGPVDSEDRYSEVRPGSALLSFFQPLGPSAFSSVTAGLFELSFWQYDSYGVMVDLQNATPDGRWTIGGSFGYLGSATYRVLNDRHHRYRIWEIVWPPDNWPYETFISYRFDDFDFQIIGRWGRFLNGDRAWRLDLERKFGEVEITIFGIKSDNRLGGADPVDRNNVRLLGGLKVKIPLYPRERRMPERFRVTTAPDFAWSYRYRVGNAGVDVTTEHRVEDFIENYNPQDIRNNLERARAQIRAFALVEERNRLGVTTPDEAESRSH